MFPSSPIRWCVLFLIKITTPEPLSCLVYVGHALWYSKASGMLIERVQPVLHKWIALILWKFSLTTSYCFFAPCFSLSISEKQSFKRCNSLFSLIQNEIFHTRVMFDTSYCKDEISMLEIIFWKLLPLNYIKVNFIMISF